MTNYNSLLNRAARLCSSGEKCEHDVREKLLTWGMTEEEIEKAMAYLRENKFVDDERFTNFFVRDKLKLNRWGRIKISFTLRHKGIKSSTIEEAMSKINEKEYTAILKELLQQKIKAIGGISSQNDKAKVLRFAAQRGFSSEEIFKTLDNLKQLESE